MNKSNHDKNIFMVYEYEYDEETQKMRINSMYSIYGSSIEDYDVVMAKTIDNLTELRKVVRIVFADTREHEYDFRDCRLLLEVALAIEKINRSKFVSIRNIATCDEHVAQRYAFLQKAVSQIRYDPIESYKWLMREMRHCRINIKNDPQHAACYEHYISHALFPVLQLLDGCELIQIAKPDLAKHKNRSLYRKIFHPTVRPNFMYTRYMSLPPESAELLERYKVSDTQIEVYKLPGKTRKLYQVIPPEFRLNDDEYAMLDKARKYIGQHEPREAELAEPERVRENILRIGLDLLRDIQSEQNLELGEKRLKQLAEILTRYTAGLGIMELLLQDEKIQDISVNSPVGTVPIYIYHETHQECETNLVPTREDAESWATRFRLLSGRPLDEANPVLDTEIMVPGGRARVSAITRTLSPEGLAFAFRRHRDKPWTLPLFIDKKMLDPFSAGLMWFMVDGARTMIVAGTRSSGKTSFLGALMVQIMPHIRTITVEDTLELPTEALRNLGYNIERLKSRSVITQIETEIAPEEALRTALRLGDSALIIGEVRSSIPGWEEVIVVENGITKRVPIEELKNKEIQRYEIPTLGFDLKVGLKPLLNFVEHPERDKLLEVTTKTGRKVTVTPDHSLFHSTKDFRVSPIECKDLKAGDSIVIPASIPVGFNDIDYLDATKILQEFRLENFEADAKKSIKKIGWKNATKMANIKTGDIYNYFRKNQYQHMPISTFKNITQAAELDFDLDLLSVNRGTGNSIPAKIPVDEDFCRFLGYYISEGYHKMSDKNGGKVVLSNSNEKVIEQMISLSRKIFNIEPLTRHTYGYGKSTQVQINSSALAALIDRIGCGRTCTEKRIPDLIFGLSRKKIAAFLRALFTGDGCFTVSQNSCNAVKYSSTSKKLIEDLAYLCLAFGIVGTIRYKKSQKENDSDNWIIEFKDREMVKTFFLEIGFERKVPDMLIRGWEHTHVNSVQFDKNELRKHLTEYPRRYRHLFRFERCSKKYLRKVVNDPECKASDQLKLFANGEFFLDEVKEIKEIILKKPVPVYDLSVEPSQNFIGGFGGILLHNTEAKALYEAMRIGALANVVAGTIHGESAYGVFDRVINDLGVPLTSFKATDIVIIANMLRSPDGLHSFRRIVEMTEVRKHWKHDPVDEGGFVNLLEYSAREDILKPTKTLLTGESMILNSIASRVRDWKGSWDAVWENINLRANIFSALVSTAQERKNQDILEAPFVIQSNSRFHLISEEVKSETGILDSAEIYRRWLEWLKKTK